MIGDDSKPEVDKWIATMGDEMDWRRERESDGLLVWIGPTAIQVFRHLNVLVFKTSVPADPPIRTSMGALLNHSY